MIYPINNGPRPKTFLKNDHLNSTFDVTSKINIFFNSLCISNITRDKRNQIIDADNTTRFVLLTSLTITITIACFYGRFLIFYFFNNNRLDPITDVAVSIVVTTNALAIFTSAFKPKTEEIREYFSNYATIDYILRVDNTRESKKINRLFMIYIILSMLKLILAPSGYICTYGVIETVPFLNLTYAFFFNDMNLLNVLLKVVILANRFKKFEEELKNELEGKWLCPEKVARFKLCYQLLFKQVYILTETHGFQFLMTCLYILFSSTTFIFLIDITEAGLALGMTLELVVSSILLTHIVCIIEMMIAARAQVIMIIEDCLVERLVERKGPSELLAQVRRQPINFSVWGLFNLNYQMLQTMISITVSYTIILTQLSK